MEKISCFGQKITIRIIQAKATKFQGANEIC